MKKIYLIVTCLFILALQPVIAQTPQKMSYQAVVRNASNDLVTNQSVGIKISILQGSATGTPVYVETQTPTTNANGLVSMEIGNGTVVNGDFTTINWANGPYFIKTETDPNGGSNYSITGTSQLLSVPYALYAEKADNVFSGDFNDLSNVPSGLSDGDDVNDADHDPSNEIQTISKTGNTITLSNGGGSVTDSDTHLSDADISAMGYIKNANDADHDPNNEIQDISLSGSNLSIANGSTVDLSTVSTANAWSINGNAGTSPATHFIGTTDDKDLVFKRNNVNAGILSHNNTAFGKGSLPNNTGNYNTASGVNALYSNTTGWYNMASGFKALYSNTTGKNNTAIGALALSSNTTGSQNTASGYGTLNSNTTGTNNTAYGYWALSSNTTGSQNTASGYKVLSLNTIGYFNTASGTQALYKNTTGSSNTASGFQALYKNTTGSSNTALGFKALYNMTTGNYNTAIGREALFNNTGGSSNTAIGYGAYSNGNYSNSTAIGASTAITANDQMRIGHNVSSIGGPVAWSNLSDGRFKRNIKENVPGLDFVMQLRPVTYYLDMAAYAKFVNTPKEVRKRENALANELKVGFVAQEVEQAAQKLGFDFHGVDKPKNENDYYGLRYAEFVVPLVKAMQEQQKTIEQQQKEIDELKSLVKQLLNKTGNK